MGLMANCWGVEDVPSDADGSEIIDEEPDPDALLAGVEVSGGKKPEDPKELSRDGLMPRWVATPPYPKSLIPDRSVSGGDNYT